MPLLRTLLSATLALTAVLATPARSQPSPNELLDAWREGAARSAEGVETVRLRETLARDIDGPRGKIRIQTIGRTELSPLLRPRRSVDELRVDGEATDVDKLRGMERRLLRALGPVARDLQRPPALAVRTLRHAEAVGAVDDVQLDGTTVWRITASRPLRRGPREHLTAWFTASSSSPRLLRLRRERPLPDGGSLDRMTTYRRVGGLDVPATHTVDAQIEQRRRLRTYTLVLHADATYGMPEIERDGSPARR